MSHGPGGMGQSSLWPELVRSSPSLLATLKDSSEVFVSLLWRISTADLAPPILEEPATGNVSLLPFIGHLVGPHRERRPRPGAIGPAVSGRNDCHKLWSRR